MLAGILLLARQILTSGNQRRERVGNGSSFDDATCYMNAGGSENWRPPAAKFPEAIIGKNLDG